MVCGGLGKGVIIFGSKYWCSGWWIIVEEFLFVVMVVFVWEDSIFGCVKMFLDWNWYMICYFFVFFFCMILDGMLVKYGKKVSLFKDGDKLMKFCLFDVFMKYEFEFLILSSNGEVWIWKVFFFGGGLDFSFILVGGGDLCGDFVGDCWLLCILDNMLIFLFFLFNRFFNFLIFDFKVWMCFLSDLV